MAAGKTTRTLIMTLVLSAGIVGTGLWWLSGKVSLSRVFTDGRTVADVIAEYGRAADKRLEPLFVNKGMKWPPDRITLIGLKQERILELWAQKENRWVRVKQYPLTAFSGQAGPKLRQGDRQIPEGIYNVTFLNPNSSYHLSMKIDYPNRFDLKHARNEGRTRPGNNIFIHGKAASIGCLAIGDPSIEELFVLVARIGMDKVKVIIAPYNFNLKPVNKTLTGPHWLPELYESIREALKPYHATS